MPGVPSQGSNAPVAGQGKMKMDRFLVLVYDRISQNRRLTFLLPLAALVLGAPLMLALSFGVSTWMARLLGHVLHQIAPAQPMYLPMGPPRPDPSPLPDPGSATALVILFAVSAVLMIALCLMF